MEHPLLHSGYRQTANLNYEKHLADGTRIIAVPKYMGFVMQATRGGKTAALILRNYRQLAVVERQLQAKL